MISRSGRLQKATRACANKPLKFFYRQTLRQRHHRLGDGRIIRVNQNIAHKGLVGTKSLRSSAYFSCTDPETVTTTAVLPASTGTGASAVMALASMASIRGLGVNPWSLALTLTSRRV